MPADAPSLVITRQCFSRLPHKHFLVEVIALSGTSACPILLLPIPSRGADTANRTGQWGAAPTLLPGTEWEVLFNSARGQRVDNEVPFPSEME